MSPETETFLRAAAAKVDDVSPGERTVVARVNTDAVDRYRTVVDPAGADLANYRRNPVVLWMHGKDPARGSVPVGRNLWVKHDKGSRSLVAKTKFHDDEFSDNLFRLYQAEILRGFSVNGRPDPAKTGPPTSAEIRSRPELAEARTLYRSWELLEYSAVDIPGNADALATAVARGLWLPAALRPAAAPAPPPAELPLPPLAGARRFSDVHAALVRACRARKVDPAGDAAAVLDLHLRGRV